MTMMQTAPRPIRAYILVESSAAGGGVTGVGVFWLASFCCRIRLLVARVEDAGLGVVEEAGLVAGFEGLGVALA